jgi:cytidylate kinase
MQNLLIKYMEERCLGSEVSPAVHGKPEPVVTISREAGCSGNEIAQKLLKKLEMMCKEHNQKSRWRVINKEVITEAALELETHPSKIEHIFKGEGKTLLEDMILSMSSRYHKSDWKIRESIRNVIRFQAGQGHVIIVGRAGVVITQDHPYTLHIKLQGPVDWRTERISKKHGIPMEEARAYVQEVDKTRQKLLQDFKCSASDCELFDAIINCKNFSADDLAEVIFRMMEVKKLV